MDQKINIVKMSTLPKAVYRLNAMTIKILTKQTKKQNSAKAISRKKNKVGGNTLSDFKL